MYKTFIYMYLHIEVVSVGAQLYRLRYVICRCAINTLLNNLCFELRTSGVEK